MGLDASKSGAERSVVGAEGGDIRMERVIRTMLKEKTYAGRKRIYATWAG